MNLTVRRDLFRRFYLPLAYVFSKIGITPNILTSLALLCGTASALAYYNENLLTALLFLLLSGLFDLLDGEVARFQERPTKFGAVYDWIVDKWVDGLILGTVGFVFAGPGWAIFAIVISMLHSFIKPVVYAEIGYEVKLKGKITDPLEGVGFFGRPETHFALAIFTILEKTHIGIGLSLGIKVITLLSSISLLLRLIYLYKNFGKVKDE